MEISIDNQYVTKSLQRYRFLPKQPKEKHRKNHKLATFFRFRLGIDCRNGKKHSRLTRYVLLTLYPQAMQQIMAVMLAVKWQCPQFVPSLSPALSQVLSQDEEKDASIDAKDATSSSKVATLDEKAASLADNRRNSAIRKQRQELYKEPH